MDKQKKINQINNLNRLKEIVEISKFDTLQKLERANKISKRFLDVALVSKKILSFIKNKYKLSKNDRKNTKKRKIWVFITPEKELISANVFKFSKILSKEFDKENDYLICVGFAACEFAVKNSYETIYSSKKISNAGTGIGNLLTKMVLGDEISKITFLCDSLRSKKGKIDIFPLEKLNINYYKKDELIINKQIFYPSINSCVNTLLNLYFSKIAKALIIEKSFYYLKEKLIKNENSIKNIDKLIEEKQREINKDIRKKTTEDLVFMSQIAKRGVK